jgi:ERCC4-related helicase
VKRTPFLVTIAVAAMLMELFPAYVGPIKWAAILLAIAYLAARALRTYPRLYRERKRQAAQLLADDHEYRDFEAELAALRARHDTQRLEVQGISPTQVYLDELQALNERHKSMLTRKFGAY